MNITSLKQVAGIYAAGMATAALVSLVGIPAVAGAVTEPAPTQATQQAEEDDPGWDWRTDGNGCRGLYGNGTLECTSYPVADAHIMSRSGHWTRITESQTWIFCPTGRSDMECGA